VRRLGDGLRDVYQKWPRWFKSECDDGSDEEKRRAFNEAKTAGHNAYNNAKTSSYLQEDPLIQSVTPHIPSMGDLLKASAAFHFVRQKGTFVFTIASYHIQYLNAHSRGAPYVYTPNIFEKLKMRKLDGLASAEAIEQEEQDASDVES